MVRRRRYTFTMKLEFPFLSYPNRVTQTHDQIASAIIGAVHEIMEHGIDSVRDCKTGRFRRLSIGVKKP